MSCKIVYWNIRSQGAARYPLTMEAKDIIPLVFLHNKLLEMVIGSEPYKNRGEINVEFTDINTGESIKETSGQCFKRYPMTSNLINLKQNTECSNSIRYHAQCG